MELEEVAVVAALEILTLDPQVCNLILLRVDCSILL